MVNQYIHIHTCLDTTSSRCVHFQCSELLHSIGFNGHFVDYSSILFHRLVPSGEITGCGLILKTQRTKLESLLQFELSDHNGRMRLPFFLWSRSVCVGECIHGGQLSRFFFFFLAHRLGVRRFFCSSHLFSYFLNEEKVVILCLAGFVLQCFLSLRVKT